MIRPSVKLTISRMENDINEIQKVYDIGKKDAETQLEALKNWLSV